MKLLLSSLLLLGSMTVVLSCRCMPRHLQDLFCHVKFVVHAVPIAVSKPSPMYTQRNYHYHGHGPPVQSNYITYTLVIIEVFKDQYRRLRQHSIKQAYTPESASACGVKLELFKQYILGGYFDRKRKMVLNSCNLNKLYRTVTPCELSLMRVSKPKRIDNRHIGYAIKNLLKKFQDYHITYRPKPTKKTGFDCSCKIQTCTPGGACHPNSHMCTWIQGANPDPNKMSCERHGYRGQCHWHECSSGNNYYGRG